ncbi:MAG: hypothetical protein LBL21_02545 [Rickettsiales bacterium]|jgi:hypothetical protein|nr:hypothetical protein [Rickettsiales bacterium]
MPKQKRAKYDDFVAKLPEGADANAEWRKHKEEEARKEREADLALEEKRREEMRAREAESNRIFAEALKKEDLEIWAAEERKTRKIAERDAEHISALALAGEMERKRKSAATVKRLTVAAVALGLSAFAVWYIALRPRNIADNGVVIYNPVTKNIHIKDVRPGGTTFKRPDTGEALTIMSEMESDFRKKNGEDMDDRFLMHLSPAGGKNVPLPSEVQKTR